MATGGPAISGALNHNQGLAGITRLRRTRNWLRRCLVFGLLLSALGAGMWLERAMLLRGAADLWVVSDEITPADAVVVLGGGIEVRPVVAADLYARGLVHKILVSQVEDERSVSVETVRGQTGSNL